MQPKVSVICVTYNHELYIRQALDSILSQKTDFDFEILVGEDCSKDGTRDILREYEKRYPDKFRMYYRDENLGATRNEWELMMDAKGDYIAALELDDIWTDDNKLQKQYDFLEAHSEYIGVAHDFDIIDKDGNVVENDDNKAIKDYLGKRFTLQDFLDKGFVFQTGTHFYRNIYKDGGDYSIIYKADRLIRDKTVLSILLDRGDFYILPDDMSAYRRYFDGDTVSGRNATNADMELDLFTKAHHVEMLNEYFGGRIDYSGQWSDMIWDYGKRALTGKRGFKIKRFLHMYKAADRKTKRKVRKEFAEAVGRVWIIKAILFMVLFLFLLRSVSYIIRTNGDTKDRFAGFYAEKKDSIDVLMMGSSTVATSFSPGYMWGKYGFTSYPLSSNSQRPKAIKYLIEEGLRYQEPKLIVIEMRTFIAEDEELAEDEGHIRETVDNMRYSLHRIKTVKAMTDMLDKEYAYQLDIIKYHSNLGMLLEPNEWKKFNYSVKNADKGFEFKYDVEGYRKETPDLYTKDRKPIPSSEEAVLRDLIAFLKENDLDALFVVTPRDESDDYEPMMNYCSDIVKEAGFEFIDLNFLYDEMGFDYRTDIDDGAHTNVWGAVKCSDVLGQFVVGNYDVISPKSEAVTDDWDTAYRHFTEQYNSAVPIEK
ncbi:MAG: glycosyltransferase family 2 protein [Lachnospiraceae bacterium]|nr:glycosyltransferase family 2 protein [Lachnospiraceae bacterium]